MGVPTYGTGGIYFCTRKLIEEEVIMNELAKNLWAFFFASMLFGVWLIPILIGVFALYVVIYIKWPEFFKKYL